MSIGEILAISCALTWSISVILFKKSSATVPPLHLNLFKNIIGFVLFIPTMLLVEGTALPDAKPEQFWTLVVSGAIGIGFADALALSSIHTVGAARFALLECIYSPAVALMSYWLLGETLTGIQWLGGGLILGAIAVINFPSGGLRIATSNRLRFGSAIGLISLVSMAYGVVLAKPLFNELPLIWLITVRLGAGTLASFATTLCTKERWSGWRTLNTREVKIMVLTAGVFSTYISMIMWISGFKYAATAVAAMLNQTATIFTLILAVVFLKERMTRRQVFGTIVAVLGVIIVTQGKQ